MRLLLASGLICCCISIAVPHARAADGLKVIVIDGGEAANIVAEKIAAEPVVEVRDRNDRRVANAVVRFLIRKTARNRLVAVFRNLQGEVRTLTDAAGRASANLSPLEPGSFQIEVEVSYQGETGKAVIRQTNYPTAADAKAAGREPGKSNSSNAQASATGAIAATATAAPAATTTSTATTAAVSTGGGMSKLAVVGLVAGGAAGAGAAVVLSQKESAAPAPAGAVSALTASVPVGIQASTGFAFSVQATNFQASSLAYRWDFGDGGTSTDPTPTHVYAAPGTYTVVVTVSDARQSVQSQTQVTVFTLTGTWTANIAFDGRPFTLNLTQAGSNISGTETAEPFTNCVVTGSVQGSSPRVVLTVAPCPHPTQAPLPQQEYRLDFVTFGTSGSTLRGAWYLDGNLLDTIEFRR